MFKVVVTINCDDCHSDFGFGRVSESSDAWEWNSQAANLVGDAEQNGWDFFRGRMRCSGCNCPQQEQ